MGKLSDCSGDYASFCRILYVSKKRMGFARACLTVSQNCAVVAVQDGVHNGFDVLEQVFLRAGLAIDVIEGEVAAALLGVETDCLF